MYTNRECSSYVSLYHEGLTYKRSVGRLVAHEFIGEPPLPFDTVIHLNGDRSNSEAMNVMWRPKWFAVKFHKQFSYDYDSVDYPIMDVNTGFIYRGIWEAAIVHGLIIFDILRSIVEGEFVWPTRQLFIQA